MNVPVKGLVKDGDTLILRDGQIKLFYRFKIEL